MKVGFLVWRFYAALAALLIVMAAAMQAQVRTPAELEMPQSHNPLSPYKGDSCAGARTNQFPAS